MPERHILREGSLSLWETHFASLPARFGSPRRAGGEGWFVAGRHPHPTAVAAGLSQRERRMKRRDVIGLVAGGPASLLASCVAAPQTPTTLPVLGAGPAPPTSVATPAAPTVTPVPPTPAPKPTNSPTRGP